MRNERDEEWNDTYNIENQGLEVGANEQEMANGNESYSSPENWFITC